MGKKDNQRLPVSQQSHGGTRSVSGNFLCQRCAMGVCRIFNLKCAVILIFSVVAFLSAISSVLPLRYGEAGFDAKDYIKLSASVQAHFKLQKPVSELIPYIARIEYDVNGELGVPSSKVAVLSMHPAKLYNWTDVVFGFLPDPINSTINTVSLSVLKSSLIDLFLQECNLTLTSSIFGEPSSFEILRFPGGITIIPERDAFPLQIPQVLFNFTLNSTINDIKDNHKQLKEELKIGLHLMANEMLFIQVKNKNGSTKDPPVTVEASVSSDLGTLLPDRLTQLAQTIIGSPPTENLGLDHTVFGKVKEVSLSSFLNHSLHVPAPASSPCTSPSPEQIQDYGPSIAPSYSPALSPSPKQGPHSSLSPVSNSPAPSVTQGTLNGGGSDPPSPSPTSHPDETFPIAAPRASVGSPLVASPQVLPSLSPLPDMAYSYRYSDERNGKGLVSQHVLSATSSGSSCTWRIPWSHLFAPLPFILFWIS